MSDERTPAAPADPPTASTVPPAAPRPVAPPAPPAADAPLAQTEAPSDDVVAAESSALPGEHRGGFHREFTEPVPITATTRTDVEWSPDTDTAGTSAPLPRSAPWALTFGILGLIVSFLVGWGFLIGLVGAGLAIVALRRPWESRPLGVWALCLSLVSVLYSAGWLWWASTQGPLFG